MAESEAVIRWASKEPTDQIVAPFKFGTTQYVTKEFQRSVRIDWRAHMKRRFQREVERKGYVLVGEVEMWLAPWDEMERDVEEQLVDMDRFRLSAMFIEKENRG